MMGRVRTLSRRGFLRGVGTTAGALVVGVGVGVDFRTPGAHAAAASDGPMPNAFVRVAPDNTVTVVIKHLDKGQGVTTGLTTIVADELDADWAQMRTVFAPADAEIYNNLFFGPFQGTGGSTSIANSWEQLRKAGAAARAMLVAAAADRWQVPADRIAVAKGVVTHAASRRHATFGELAIDAASMPVPKEVKLKPQTDWVYIGKHVPRIDSVPKTTGTAVYSMDVKRPDMLTAVVARPPRFGATVRSFDAAAARQVRGVVDVVRIPQGVAVLAGDTWSAIRGRAALQVDWDETKAEKRSTAAMLADYRKVAADAGLTAARRGDAQAALDSAARLVEAEFTFPYLAHAPMEPLNGVIEMKPDGTVEIWAGSQLQTVDQGAVAAILDLKPQQVRINTVWAGGSFGRRSTPDADYISEMAALAKATGGKAPIHLIWTREDDIRGGRYRPMFYHTLRAGLDSAGKICGWEHHIVGQSFLIGTPLEAMVVKNGVDEVAVEGAADIPYAIPNLTVVWHKVDSPVTTLWWRSVGHSHTAQAVEVTVDRLAEAAGKDPVDIRLALLEGHPRHAAVLRLAAEKAGWGENLPPRRGRGVALHASYGSYLAMVADVTANADGSIRVDRVVAAVDCGVPVNPDVIRAQIEGGIGFGLGAALRSEITLTDGVVDQSNFDGYEPLRISDMPTVEVHIVPSGEPPTGIGEPGVAPIAPAVTNAIFKATGLRLYSLPWGLDRRKGA
jgi:isoquinoline 1-oxidoreductase beta subunit